MNFLATHVMNIFGEFQVPVTDIRAMQALSEPLHFNICSKPSVSILFPQSNFTWALSKPHSKWTGFMWNSPSIIYLDCLGSLACLLPVCNELEQIHLRRDMKCLEGWVPGSDFRYLWSNLPPLKISLCVNFLWGVPESSLWCRRNWIQWKNKKTL